MKYSINKWPKKNETEKKSLLESLIIPATLAVLTIIYFANRNSEKKQQEILNHPQSQIEFYVKNDIEFIDFVKKTTPKGVNWKKTAMKDMELNRLNTVYIPAGKYKFYIYGK